MFRLLSIAVVCTLLLIPIAGYGSNIISNTTLLIVFTFGLGYVVLPAVLLHLWPTKYDRAVGQPMSVALAEGNLITRDYVASEVAELEEFEEEGLHFLFAIEAGQTLCLAGQYLCAPVERNTFPSTRFRVFTNRVTGAIYGVEPTSQVVDGWRVYGKFTESVDQTLEDGRVYDQSITELIDALGGEEMEASRPRASAEQALAADAPQAARR